MYPNNTVWAGRRKRGYSIAFFYISIGFIVERFKNLIFGQIRKRHYSIPIQNLQQRFYRFEFRLSETLINNWNFFCKENGFYMERSLDSAVQKGFYRFVYHRCYSKFFVASNEGILFLSCTEWIHWQENVTRKLTGKFAC